MIYSSTSNKAFYFVALKCAGLPDNDILTDYARAEGEITCTFIHNKNTCDQDIYMHNTQPTLTRCVTGFDELHWIII